MLYSILLAGGLSSRMGEDKARLKIGNETLLERALKLLKLTGSERILISGAIEGYECIEDLAPQSGPLGGIYSCLSMIADQYKLDDSPIIVIPVDMPNLTFEALAKLISGVHGQRCCHYEQEIFPCSLRASEELFVHLQKIFVHDVSERVSGKASGKKNSKNSMKAVMKFLSANSIASVDLPKDAFMNVNRPEDLLRLD